jgi:hypothetical protein
VSIPVPEGRPLKADPVYFHFSPFYHIAGCIYLLPVVIAFLLRENRTRAALLILLPMLLVWGAWRGFAAAVGIPDEAMTLFSAIVISLLCGFGTVWLLAERIGNRHRFTAFLLAGVTMLLCMALMAAEIQTPRYRMQLALLAVMCVLILLGGFVFAGVLSRKKFGPVRFSVWLGLGLLLTSFLVLGSVTAVQVYRYFELRLLWIIGVQILIITLVFFLLMLPFLVLFFVNGFWRQRFAAIMKMPTPNSPGPAVQTEFAESSSQ